MPFCAWIRTKRFTRISSALSAARCRWWWCWCENINDFDCIDIFVAFVLIIRMKLLCSISRWNIKPTANRVNPLKVFLLFFRSQKWFYILASLFRSLNTWSINGFYGLRSIGYEWKSDQKKNCRALKSKLIQLIKTKKNKPNHTKSTHKKRLCE